MAQDVPLPDRNPLRIDPVAPEPPLHPREHKADEWLAQDIQAALDNCAMMLDESGADYELIAPLREGICGAPAPVMLRSVGKTSPVMIEPPAQVTCAMAASLSAWSDTVLQPAAERHFGSKVQSIRNVASYVCRNRYNEPGKRISQHALANALDMAAFTLGDGRVISVLDHWHETEAVAASETTDDEIPATAKPNPGPIAAQASEALDQPADVQGEPIEAPIPTSRADFLHHLHAGACAMFGTVLGPLANEAHKDHFHFDLAPRNHSNFCE